MRDEWPRPGDRLVGAILMAMLLAVWRLTVMLESMLASYGF